MGTSTMGRLVLVAAAMLTASCASTSTTGTSVEAAPVSPGAVQSSDDPWELVGLPGEQHEVLARLAGEWEITAEVWVDPNEPGVSSCQRHRPEYSSSLTSGIFDFHRNNPTRLWGLLRLKHKW